MSGFTAKDAAIEVSMPVLASTLVIIAVFFPVMFLTGIAKFLFSPLAITVAGAMIGSYIFSLTCPFGANYNNTEFTRGFQGYVGWNIPLGQVLYGGDSKMAESRQELNNLAIEETSLLLSRRIREYTEQLKELTKMEQLAAAGGRFAKAALDQALQRQAEGIGNT